MHRIVDLKEFDRQDRHTFIWCEDFVRLCITLLLRYPGMRNDGFI